ncbi:GhoT/OrtT family toxin [Salmonella enterica]|uniref:GhoT/OrtT family toxin n=1 Tax=Salmonella enterica TaxID=28901 RepID=A0A5Y5TA06_SALER|nr:GhoT/OrtT family toxin [Salmonella enterica]ECA4486783.1 GhoT/OrtT family toxin [Salmonella enterica subsp. enterica serovar Weltevreden]ECB3799827.1 GhoT/OrtT family toxin [Salmonella enterica subsp. enterica serovar Typhimurium]ECD1162936.1 GhoT/OrtT family toxin [Salmonella enterica subsp. enterica serovar Richmond]ECF4139148.1 GhoT/OrtT family toxin [Salmonella enterica subsp. enterica serovar Bareilly]ECG6735436.1 GhoT/OrtT family toxin [Salmonella enterica subsp. enterica serovar Lexi
MSAWEIIEIVYIVMFFVSGVIIWFLSCEEKSIRLLSAVLTGATWPISLPVALLFSLL